MSARQPYVGMDLDAIGGEVVQAIIEAVGKDNTGVVVEDYSTYVKVKAPKEMRINRATVAECLGRDWSMDDMQIYMSSYFGFIEDWDEEQMLIRWNNV